MPRVHVCTRMGASKMMAEHFSGMIRGDHNQEQESTGHSARNQILEHNFSDVRAAGPDL